MADELYLINGSTLTDIGNAIRSKTGETSTIQVSNYASKIRNIDAAPVCHTVTFKGMNNEILETYQVEHGKNFVYTGKTPTSTDALFIGWSTIPSNITSSLTVISNAGALAYNCSQFTIEEGNKFATIHGYNGSGNLLVIPSQNTNGKSVIGINSDVSFGSNITTIVLPSSMVNIEGTPFSSCANLQDVYYTGTKSQWFKLLESKATAMSALCKAPRIHTSDGCIISS